MAAPAPAAEKRPLERAKPAEAEAAPPPASPAEQAAATAARPTAASARELRRARARRLLLRLSLFVALPTAVAGVYYAAVAADQFESYSLFTIHSAEVRPALALESLLTSVGGTNSRDVLNVRDYVLSRDMLERLNKEHGFIAHYQAGSIDWISRLAHDASFEDAYEYFESKIYADFDMVSGALTLRIRAFSPEKAREFSRAVLSYSEEMVNKLSERERRDRTQYAEAEVAKAEQRLTKARQEILALQQKHSEFNPLETAGAAMTLRTQLEGELAKARAELMELRAFMQPDAPRVKAAQERVNSIAAQVASEGRRIDPKREGGLVVSLPEFEAAMIEKEFAQKAYESAMAALEIARSDAVRQHRYLATIASPSTPDESTYPRRILSVFTVFVVSFLILGIGTLMSAAVREHARL
jgi:capsular polysaccharide transport system permease protein